MCVCGALCVCVLLRVDAKSVCGFALVTLHVHCKLSPSLQLAAANTRTTTTTMASSNFRAGAPQYIMPAARNSQAQEQQQQQQQHSHSVVGSVSASMSSVMSSTSSAVFHDVAVASNTSATTETTDVSKLPLLKPCPQGVDCPELGSFEHVNQFTHPCADGAVCSYIHEPLHTQYVTLPPQQARCIAMPPSAIVTHPNQPCAHTHTATFRMTLRRRQWCQVQRVVVAATAAMLLPLADNPHPRRCNTLVVAPPPPPLLPTPACPMGMLHTPALVEQLVQVLVLEQKVPYPLPSPLAPLAVCPDAKQLTCTHRTHNPRAVVSEAEATMHVDMYNVLHHGAFCDHCGTKPIKVQHTGYKQTRLGHHQWLCTPHTFVQTAGGCATLTYDLARASVLSLRGGATSACSALLSTSVTRAVGWSEPPCTTSPTPLCSASPLVSPPAPRCMHLCLAS